MSTYILKRLVEAALVCFGISVITFLLLHGAGDPVHLLLPIESKAEDAVVLRKTLGLDQPLVVQYLIFLKGLARLDFGNSLFVREPALNLVLERFPATVQLTLAGMAIALAIAIPLGVIAAVRRYSFLDNLCTMLAVSGQAMPIFWLGLMLIIFFSVKLHLLPASGRGTLLHLLMPAFTLGASLAPITMRMTRIEDAGHPHGGLHPDGARQGTPRADRSFPPCPPECLDPHRHHSGVAVRATPGRRHRHRGRLCLAGAGGASPYRPSGTSTIPWPRRAS